MIDRQPTRPPVLGSTLLPGGRCQFVVWAPSRKRVDLQLLQQGRLRSLPMERDALGYYHVVAEEAAAGATYFYRLDNSQQRPDPASRYQPQGVHGPSEVVDLSGFHWTDGDWKGLPLEEHIFYELHVGTYTPEGTFAAIGAYLDKLADLGVTTVELMPIAQFPGGRNWGYDGVYPYAAQNTYGTPRDLQYLVNAAHSRGLAIALDVVYNHLGPEGNYLGEYGPYFTGHYRTPWGSALNFDQAHSDEVRHFFVQNALYWLKEFHIDALRLDAVHSIFDGSAFPFLAELSTQVAALSAQLGCKIQLIAESDLNDAGVLRAVKDGGLGMDAQWSDDFHHSIHALLTSETQGYYADFGGTQHLAGTLKNGWYYTGQYSRHRQRKHGNKPRDLAAARFVVCSQNHDQVGNRATGDRLSTLVDFESLKLAAGITILSSFLPLVFMGEEYGEVAPFQYFTSHGDPILADTVRKGREREFSSFDWKGQVPDPQADATFAASKLNHALTEEEPHHTLLQFYKALLAFRIARRLMHARQQVVAQHEAEKAILVQQQTGETTLIKVFHFGDSPATLLLPPGRWRKAIDSAEPEWHGKQSASVAPSSLSSNCLQITLQGRSFVVLEDMGLIPVEPE
jgi:maltooligosyltrehalose trehalohydrolase